MIIDMGDTIVNTNNVKAITKGVELVNIPVSTKYEWNYYIKIDNISINFTDKQERDDYFNIIKRAMI